jgi:hypothetical protein
LRGAVLHPCECKRAPPPPLLPPPPFSLSAGARERRCRPCALTEAASVLWLPSVGNRRRGARAQPRRRRRAIKGAYARPDSLHTETAPKVSRLWRLSFVSLCVSVAFTPSAQRSRLRLFCFARAPRFFLLWPKKVFVCLLFGGFPLSISWRERRFAAVRELKI